jgi:hypothetical protein
MAVRSKTWWARSSLECNRRSTPSMRPRCDGDRDPGGRGDRECPPHERERARRRNRHTVGVARSAASTLELGRCSTTSSIRSRWWWITQAPQSASWTAITTASSRAAQLAGGSRRSARLPMRDGPDCGNRSSSRARDHRRRPRRQRAARLPPHCGDYNAGDALRPLLHSHPAVNRDRLVGLSPCPAGARSLRSDTPTGDGDRHPSPPHWRTPAFEEQHRTARELGLSIGGVTQSRLYVALERL